MAGKPTIDRRLDSDSGRESQEAGRGQRTTVAPTSASPCGREAAVHMLGIIHVSSIVHVSSGTLFWKKKV